MRRKLYMIAAILGLVSCNPAPKALGPSIQVKLSDISSTGCVVEVEMAEGTTGYLMKVVPASGFDSATSAQMLEQTAPFTAAKRVIERLHSEKDYVVVARGINDAGGRGDILTERFTLTELGMTVQLYTPGDETGSLNRYNALNVVAFTNGLAASGRCALAVNDVWLALKAEKGLEAAAEEVFGNNCVEYTKQQLEEMADRNPLKRDLMNYGELDEGTTYAYIVCLVDLDGGSHYFTFEGSTKAH